jgi:hypothetical protein
MENQMTKSKITTVAELNKKYQYKWADLKTPFSAQTEKAIDVVVEELVGLIPQSCYKPNDEDRLKDNVSLRYKLGYRCSQADNGLDTVIQKFNDWGKAICQDLEEGLNPKEYVLDVHDSMRGMCELSEITNEIEQRVWLRVIKDEGWTKAGYQKWCDERRRPELDDGKDTTSVASQRFAKK